MRHTGQTVRNTFTRVRRNSKMRHREIAEQLQISEGELIAAHVGPASAQEEVLLQATRLHANPADWPLLLAALEPLGRVLALTRNASCVHEKTGVYRRVSHCAASGQGLLQGDEQDGIALRLCYQHWAHGFAVAEQTQQGLQRSLQFFDAAGVAVHKLFMQAHSNLESYGAWVQRFAAAPQVAGMEPLLPAPKASELPDAQLDVAGLRQAWDGLRDTDDFSDLLTSFSVSATQALRLADAKYVQQVESSACQSLLLAAASNAVAIQVRVGNAGAMQMYSGQIQRVIAMGPWVNVLDPGFNLHLREDRIASAWVVKKPTVDGLVSALELFDAQGQTIAMFLAERKPGQPERCGWRLLIDNIQQEAQACTA